VTVLLAPNSYIESRTDAELFDARVSYEDLIEHFEVRARSGETDEARARSRYRVLVFEQAVYQYRRRYSPEIDAPVTDFWDRYWRLATTRWPQLRLERPGPKPAGAGFVAFRGLLPQIPGIPRCEIKHCRTSAIVGQFSSLK
jgi:uncharacterized protein YchJ